MFMSVLITQYSVVNVLVYCREVHRNVERWRKAFPLNWIFSPSSIMEIFTIHPSALMEDGRWYKPGLCVDQPSESSVTFGFVCSGLRLIHQLGPL